MGVEQNKPIFTPGVANFDESDAKAKSQLATNWQPAAVATPFTSAITGFGQFTIICISDEHKVNRFMKYDSPLSSSSLALVISFKLCPEQKTSPTASITITFNELSTAASVKLFLSIVIIFLDNAFLLLGSSNIRRKIPF